MKNGNILDDALLNKRLIELRHKMMELEQENRTVFAQSNDAIFVVNPETGIILEANNRASSMTGFMVAQLVGKAFDDLILKKPYDFGFHPSQESDGVDLVVKRQGRKPINVEMRTCAIQTGKETLQLVSLQPSVWRDLSKSQTRTPTSQINSLSSTGSDSSHFPSIVGKSEEIRVICRQIGQVAKTDSTVLIQGESGTGKEIIAEAIHYHSSRATAPFVKVNCAALSEMLLESELFGHAKGAFTGAIRDRRGRFVQADRGTILLDEINCMSLSGQAKLLRVLQEKEFEPVGSSETTAVNVRVVVASNVDLTKSVADGTFREDLFYRLNVFPMTLPPLRDRKEDIILLAQHFLRRYNLAVGKQIHKIAPETQKKLTHYDWPGNVRELENAVEHAIIVGQGPMMEPDDLPTNLSVDRTEASDEGDWEALGLRDKLLVHERQIIRDALIRANGIKKKAADLLQIDPRNFPYLLRKHNLI